LDGQKKKKKARKGATTPSVKAFRRGGNNFGKKEGLARHEKRRNQRKLEHGKTFRKNETGEDQ